MKHKAKKIFNQGSNERFEEEKIIGGNPNGIINFNRSPYNWSYPLYKNMLARTWFAEQVNVSKDKVNYSQLTSAEKRMYDLVLAQLITNDSIQTNQLMDRMNTYITESVVNALLARQTYEESMHSQAYAVMAEDIACDTDRIYNMHHHDEELRLKNQAVQDMYDSVFDIVLSETDDTITYKKPSSEDLLMCFLANQILEEMVFPGGFAAMLSLESKMPGSCEMIKEIMGDETLSHVPLFMNIFRTAVKENFNGEIPDSIKVKGKELIVKMCEAEKRWTKYATKDLLGFTDRSIDIFIQGKANSVCKNLGFELIYPVETDNPLQKLLNKSLKGGEVESRTNFFEANSVEYTKGSFNSEDDWNV